MATKKKAPAELPTQSSPSFKSWVSFVDHVATVEDSPYWTAVKASHYASESFAGTPDFKSALQLARNGWPEGIGSIKAAAAIIAQKAPGKARDYDVSGMYPDAARAAAGDPCSMVTPAPGEIRSPSVVTVILGLAGSAYVPASCWINRAGAIAALADALESAGSVRLEIWAHWSTIADRKATRARRDLFVKIKSAQDNLNLANLAAVCHPSAFRRLYFRITETMEDLGEKWMKDCFGGYGGAGKAIDAPEESLPVARALILPAISAEYDSSPHVSWHRISQWAKINGIPLTQSPA